MRRLSDSKPECHPLSRMLAPNHVERASTMLPRFCCTLQFFSMRCADGSPLSFAWLCKRLVLAQADLERHLGANAVPDPKISR